MLLINQRKELLDTLKITEVANQQIVSNSDVAWGPNMAQQICKPAI